MRLHEDREEFIEYINQASVYFGVDPALIEKDYYLTLFLSRAKDEIPGMVFKGGTSLSKCHKIIDRFSEDIDLTLDTEHFTQSPKRTANKTIIRICKDLGLALTNEEKIWSHREYNCFNVAYPILFPSEALKSELKIEMTYIQKCYPDETKRMDSLIGEFLRATGCDDAEEEYGLQDFEIKVQSLDRTLVDKVFAVCDYMLRGQTTRQSRHIYDLSRLLTKVELNDELKSLAASVREDRKSNKTCVSAQDGMDIPQLLGKIIETDYYRKDYEDSTEKLLTKPLSYKEAIKALVKIAESGVFLVYTRRKIGSVYAAVRMCENGAKGEPKEKLRRKFQINKTTGGTLKQAFLLLIKKLEKICEKALTKATACIIKVVSIRPKEDNEMTRNTEEQAYGKYGTLAKIYLEEHEPARCWALGKDLPDYLHGIDRQSGEKYDIWTRSMLF